MTSHLIQTNDSFLVLLELWVCSSTKGCLIIFRCLLSHTSRKYSLNHSAWVLNWTDPRAPKGKCWGLICFVNVLRDLVAPENSAAFLCPFSCPHHFLHSTMDVEINGCKPNEWAWHLSEIWKDTSWLLFSCRVLTALPWPYLSTASFPSQTFPVSHPFSQPF